MNDEEHNASVEANEDDCAAWREFPPYRPSPEETEHSLRLTALEFALRGDGANWDGEDVIARAKAFLSFLKGES